MVAHERPKTSAASGNVRLVHDVLELLIAGVSVSPDDVSTDHAALLLVAGVIGAVEREVAQRGELCLDAVQPRGVRRRRGVLAAALSVHELAAFGGDGPVGLHEHDLSLVGQRIL